MKSNYYTLLFSFLICQAGFSQGCDCDFTISLDQYIFDGELLGVEPGDIVCFESGTRSGIKIRNTYGTIENPIVFQNCAGTVIIDGFVMGFGLNFDNCSNFQLSGAGTEGVEYGIQVDGAYQNGINFFSKSTGFEVDHIAVTNTNGYAISAYSQPKCDLETNRGHFTLSNINLHHLNIYDCEKGIIIGHPQFSSFMMHPLCGPLYPHNVENAIVSNSQIVNINANGIILNGVSGEITDNEIDEIGEIAVYSRYCDEISLIRNEISNTIKAGFKSDGSGLYNFENNLFFNNGSDVDNAVQLAFYNPVGSTEPNKLTFVNNTVVNSGKSNLKIDASVNATEACNILNNIFAAPNVLSGSPAVSIDSSDYFLIDANIMRDNIMDVYFKDLDASDFRLTHESPALNIGADVDFETDIADGFRNLAGGVDAGAYEYIPEPLAYFKELPLVGLYVDDFKNIIGDADAETELLNFAKDNGFNYLLLYNLSYIHSHTYDLTDPEEAAVLADFIYRAKTEFGIAQVGAVGEKNASFDKIQVYNGFYDDWFKKIDVLNLEFEFWANTDGAAFVYYCENYLEPGGYDCTNEDAFEFYAIELEAIDNRAHEMGIISEIYLGSPSDEEMIELCEISDRILIHYYKTSDTYGDGRSIYNYHPDRLRAMTLSERKPAMMPIFSSRSYHMGPWLLENSLHQAMDTWLTGEEGYFEDVTPGVSDLKIAGFQWYRYTSFLDLIPEYHFRGKESENDMDRTQIELKDVYSVFPTVVEDKLNLIIEGDNEKLDQFCTIVDSKGTVVFSSAFTDRNNIFDVDHLAKGFYYLNVIEDGAVIYAQKIIK